MMETRTLVCRLLALLLFVGLVVLGLIVWAGDTSAEDIVAAGHAKDAVDKTIALVEKNEYKRRQAPVGLRVTSKAFGTGRRFPIARKI